MKQVIFKFKVQLLGFSLRFNFIYQYKFAQCDGCEYNSIPVAHHCKMNDDDRYNEEGKELYTFPQSF